MGMEGLFRPKIKTELDEQVKKAEELLGAKLPPPHALLYDFDISHIKNEHKTRYAAYLEALRAEKTGISNTTEILHAKEWITALNNLDKYITEHESHTNPLLREKQFIVFKKIRDFLEQGKRKGYVKLPTGVGKTVLFLKIAEALGMKTLIASPSIIILDQNANETEEYTDAEFGKYYGYEKDLEKQVTHITYHSLVKGVKSGKIDPKSIPVNILDEAHESMGTERQAVIDQLEGLVIGFTATSEFSDEKKLSNTFEEIFRMDVTEAIKEGLICQTQTIHAYTNVDLSTVDIKNGEYDQNQLEKAVNTHGRNMAALELYKNKFNGMKLFVNCSGVKHAEDIAQLFNDNGVKAACITGETSKDERTRILKEYTDGTIKVLTNARVLLRGFNEPTCAVTFNLHPTLSFVDAEQRARSGRLDKNNRDKWSYVIDFIDQNSKKPQVLYSEILDSDRVWDITKNEENIEDDTKNEKDTPTPRPPINLEGLSMDGLRVVVDTQMIMEITNSNRERREPQEKKEWTFEALQTDVRAKGIKSSKQYDNKYAENQWPTTNTLTSKSEFPKNPDRSNDWDTFLGREKRKEWTFEALQTDVRAKGIKSSKQYRKKYTENQWPAQETLTSKSEFPKNLDGSNDWNTFLGTEKRKEWTFEALQADVRSKGIKSSEDYAKKASENQWTSQVKLTSKSEFPKNPDRSNDWDTFLGKK